MPQISDNLQIKHDPAGQVVVTWWMKLFFNCLLLDWLVGGSMEPIRQCVSCKQWRQFLGWIDITWCRSPISEQIRLKRCNKCLANVKQMLQRVGGTTIILLHVIVEPIGHHLKCTTPTRQVASYWIRKFFLQHFDLKPDMQTANKINNLKKF